MMNLSPLQLLSLWEKLLECKYNDNSYGGNIAEIYLYTVMGHSPYLAHEGVPNGGALELYREANKTLYEVCKLFEERHDVTLKLFEGQDEKPTSLKGLLDAAPYTHRVHIGIAA